MKLFSATFVLFAASFASAQSLPPGTPTDIKITHVGPERCASIINIIAFGRDLCRQSVTVRAATSNPNAVGFDIVLLYRDSNGNLGVTAYATLERDPLNSAYFIYTFYLDNITIAAVEAMPVLSDVADKATVTNVP